MSKRKRSGEPSLDQKLEKHREDIFRAIKTAKGFERQRLSKRLRDDGLTPVKQERLEREVAVLKSLDLHQTARAHLYSSLLKVKSIAASTDLPDHIRNGVPKPEISEEERSALHNVTSGLCNRQPVKQAVERAIDTVCQTLNLPNSEKGKPSKRLRKNDIEEATTGKATSETSKEAKLVLKPENVEDQEDDVTDFEGFESDVDEPGPAIGDTEKAEEEAYSKLDDLLGGSDEEDDEDFSSEAYAQFRGKEKVNLDDISLSGSGSEEDEVDEEGEEDEGEITDAEESEASDPPSPPPESKKQKENRKKAKAAAGPTTGSTFLPSLMGGYISGSESASDVDVAPPKKRRGQRARQAIWEKKYGRRAKHLQNPNGNSGRDDGWDMRRGAVDGDEHGRRGPWKKGISNPLSSRGEGLRSAGPPRPPPPTKKDNEGPLHPSWEARKKAKDSQKEATFAGKKITFD